MSGSIPSTKRNLLIACGILVGAVAGFWLIHGSRGQVAVEQLRRNALCVLELRPGTRSVSASFSTSHTVTRLRVAMNPGAKDEQLCLSLSGVKGIECIVTVRESSQFGLGSITPGSHTAVLEQKTGRGGGVAVIAVQDAPGVTGWQIMSRTLVGVVIATGIWAAAMRRSANPRRRARSMCAFQFTAVPVFALFLMLFFHEGGHSLAECAFGRYDLASSDFFGIHGYPHSGGKSGSALPGWQQTLITGSGPGGALLAGFAFWLVWRSRRIRQIRAARPGVNFCISSITGLLLFPAVIVIPLTLAGLPDETQAFVDMLPGSAPIQKLTAAAIAIATAAMLWRVAPEIWRSFLALKSRVEK